MESTPFSSSPFVLAGIRVEPGLNAIHRDGHSVTVEPQVMRLLLHLCAHVDETCTRQQLMAEVWPESLPNEEALTQAVSKLRKALGDTRRTRLRTVRKVGYRLAGPISMVTETSSSPRAAIQAPRSRRWVWQFAAVLLIGFAISRFKVIAVHHDGVEGPRMVRIQMIKESGDVQVLSLPPDSLGSPPLHWVEAGMGN